MKFFIFVVFICSVVAIASSNSLEEIEEQREKYFIDIENVNIEDDDWESLLPEIDNLTGKNKSAIIISLQIKIYFTDINPSSRSMIAGWQARKKLRNIQRQMACGFPSYGIPPLAPYTNEDLALKLKKSFIDTISELIHLRFDGLDRFEIKKFSVGVIFKTVKFHFDFGELRLRSEYDTNTFIDLMNQFGFDVKYEGKGSIDMSLKHLEIKGSFKYKMPIFWGTMKIYKLKCVVTLRDFESDIQSGLLGTGSLNRKFNDVLEKMVVSSINDHQQEISDKIEEMLVPRVNAALKGHKIWYLFSMLGNTGDTCVPPASEPWYN